MSEYIRIGAVGAAFYKARGSGAISPDEYDAATWVLSKLEPQEDVAPVVYGRNMDNACSGLFECSVCGWSCGDTLHGDTETYNYCPNCGAKMDAGA